MGQLRRGTNPRAGLGTKTHPSSAGSKFDASGRLYTQKAFSNLVSLVAVFAQTSVKTVEMVDGSFIRGLALLLHGRHGEGCVENPAATFFSNRADCLHSVFI